MYPWKPDYIAALCEVNEKKARQFVIRAAAAIEKRLRYPVEPGSEEEKELKQARQIIAVMGKAYLRADKTKGLSAD